MNPGRNDPCPCGSGRKYKHCCLRKGEVVSDEEAHRRRSQRALEPLDRELKKEAERRLTEDEVDAAWAEFQLDEEAEFFEAPSRLARLFFSWLVYDRRPIDAAGAPAPTIAESFLARAGRRLDTIARRYVEACLATPLSFHEVIDRRTGERLRLRDMMLDAEADVVERTVPLGLQVGDCIFGRVVTVDGTPMLEVIAGSPIPPSDKPMLTELRKTLEERVGRVDVETLRTCADELREVYLDFDEMLDDAESVVDDDETIEYCAFTYDLDAPEDALARLEDLADELSEPRVVRDRTGRLLRAHIFCARPGDQGGADPFDAELGALHIDGNVLTAEASSARRVVEMHELVRARLGDSAHLRSDGVRFGRWIDGLDADADDADSFDNGDAHRA
jgi:hypothetical protein